MTQEYAPGRKGVKPPVYSKPPAPRNFDIYTLPVPLETYWVVEYAEKPGAPTRTTTEFSSYNEAAEQHEFLMELPAYDKYSYWRINRCEPKVEVTTELVCLRNKVNE